MGKINETFTKKSLKLAFAQYMIVCILASLFLSLLLSNFFSMGQTAIARNYQQHYNQYIHEITINNKDSYNLQLRPVDISNSFSGFPQLAYNVLGFLSVGIYPLCFIFFIIITSIRFYKKQLDKPLTILSKAADNIAENNLDFEISYEKENELGKLCLSFEKMRVALRDNNLEMWRQVEERKRLNAAFAHDLRTPLTVLKGQSEMLVKYSPKMSEEKIISTAEMMQRHIIRLEAYVKTMNDLQSLEDIEIKKELVAINSIYQQLNMTGTAICTEKDFLLHQNIADTQTVRIDLAVVMQIYENLLSNAVRYANSKVLVSLDKQEDFFVLTVQDDGAGFTAKDLANAVKPFYKAENETTPGHLGMGLNICKTLCEKHGGYLQLSNSKGAKVIAAFKE